MSGNTGVILLLIIYFIIVMLLTLFLTHKSKTTEDFLVSDRNIGPAKMSLSIAATWIWAPALFISAQYAYQWGFAGWAWFFGGNITTLLLFGLIAPRVRNAYPEGFSIAGFFQKIYGSRSIRLLSAFELGVLSIFSTAIQVFAGALVLHMLAPGISFFTLTVLMALIPLIYSLYSGIRASVITDDFQMATIAIPIIIFAILIIGKEGMASMFAGMGGISGKFGNVFNGTVAFQVGIVYAISLLVCPWGDQSMWQRIFSTEKKSIWKAHVWGALEFAIVPIGMGIIGWIAAGTKFIPKNAGVTNFEFIGSLFPSWALYVFAFMMLSGLMSTIDSHLCAFASLASDVFPKKFNLNMTRWAMVLTCIGGILIANVKGANLVTLAVTLGTFRASVFVITILMLKRVLFDKTGVLVGIIFGMIVGTSLYVYAAIPHPSPGLRLAAMLISVFMPAVIAALFTLVKQGRLWLEGQRR